MAMEQLKDCPETAAVHYPSSLLRSLNAVVSRLRKDVLEGAKNGALERNSDHADPVIVSHEDLLAATRAVLPAILSELEEDLTRQESSYVKRAS